MFSVKSPLANGLRPAVAVLLERNHKPKVDLSYVSGRYRLTQRELETVDHLVQGFNTKGIADGMNISPNTVKAFLRSIMMKMGTDTRAGIIAKILQASISMTRETTL
jgi:DNA-binding CsgD family transcriptional regulator